MKDSTTIEILPGIRPKHWWENFWNTESADYGAPSKTLLERSSEFFEQLKKDTASPTAVDIGSGNGRYAIPLAKRGYITDALELTSAGVERLRRTAELEGVVINARQGDFTTCYLEPRQYNLVISSGLIEEVDPAHHKNLVTGFQNWTAPGGYALIKYCLEIKGRGQLVEDGLVPKLFRHPGWEILYVEEEQNMHPSKAQFTQQGQIDSEIRTGTVIARKHIRTNIPNNS
jgi:cyclopropane fatty-acyl-phospholipid synthase-like methyltransferase